MPLLHILKIKFPNVFGIPRPVYQLDEVKAMIKFIEDKTYKLDNDILTVKFDVSSDLKLQEDTKKYNQNNDKLL
jgi:hypothetical protein